MNTSAFQEMSVKNQTLYSDADLKYLTKMAKEGGEDTRSIAEASRAYHALVNGHIESLPLGFQKKHLYNKPIFTALDLCFLVLMLNPASPEKDKSVALKGLFYHFSSFVRRFPYEGYKALALEDKKCPKACGLSKHAFVLQELKMFRDAKLTWDDEQGVYLVHKPHYSGIYTNRPESILHLLEEYSYMDMEAEKSYAPSCVLQTTLQEALGEKSPFIFS